MKTHLETLQRVLMPNLPLPDLGDDHLEGMLRYLSDDARWAAIE